MTPNMTEPTVEISQEEIDAIIKNKRKAREPKACYACHRRKVKCDRQLPCDSCIKRDHPELCSYERPSKRRQIAVRGPTADLEHPSRAGSPAYSTATEHRSSPAHSEVKVTVSKEQWDKMQHDLRTMQETIHHLRSGIQSTDKPGHAGINRSDEREREGIHAPSGQMGTVHLGSRSVLAYMMGLGRSKSNQEAAITLLEENILPKLGLDNETATYPFVDLWSTEANPYDVSGLCKAMPDDQHCREFFNFYRDVACVIYPVISDTNAFEANMNILLTNRAYGMHLPGNGGPEKPFGVTITWLGLFFAVLASGSQSSKTSAKERELTSQVYTCCAYQALRMANFMNHPSLETIQAFLIISNVLSYNMNPGVAYILLGMTMRMALSLGLQADSHRFSGSEQYLRRRVWWALAWQDSHFSMSYDRPSASALCGAEIPYRVTSMPGHRSYAESMFRIIELTQGIIRQRILNPGSTMTSSTIQRCKDEIARIVADGSAHLRDRSYCLSTVHHLERLALKLHTSYISSELCRPALKGSPALAEPTGTSTSSPYVKVEMDSTSSSKDSSPYDPIATQLRRDCIVNLERTIAAYLELHSISSLAARSWIGIQRAISAAFLLGTLEEAHQDPNILGLLRQLEQVISERTKTEHTFFESDLQSPQMGSACGIGSGSRSRENSGSGPGGVSGAKATGNAQAGPSSESPHWARSMTRSLKGLRRMNAALASPANGGLASSLGTYGAPALNAGMIAAGTHPSISNVLQTSVRAGPMSPSSTTMAMPATPESSHSGDWTFGNLGERAAEYVQPALWG